MTAPSNVLDVTTLPDPDAKRRYDDLVGLDEVKRLFLTALKVAVNPASFNAWSLKQPALSGSRNLLANRPPLFILAGDVGSGKSELAETIGDQLARNEKVSVTLFRLSLSARGSGFVGEMTQRIVSAFGQVKEWLEARLPAKSPRSVAILLVDEADALAQSRETLQMHHEDRAGVNALIRGIDDLTRVGGPVAIILATNRLAAIDPAVRRRATQTFEFARPSPEERRLLLISLLPSIEADPALSALIQATGETPTRPYGFSYSDIKQRLIPAAILRAFSAGATFDAHALLAESSIQEPTPPFRSE